jgi:RimJ/RimL family protein N-acetyltransferase
MVQGKQKFDEHEVLGGLCMTLQTLETERFHLRPLAESDEALYVSIYTDGALMRYVGDPMTAADAQRAFRAFLRSNQHGDLRRSCCWVVEHGRERQETVGLLALTPHAAAAEIGVMILGVWQSRKVAQEAIGFLSGYLFDHGVWSRTFSRHLRANEAGAGVMRRLGFREMEDVPGGANFRGWEMARDEWRQHNIQATGVDK